MESPLEARVSSAGALFSGGMFRVPEFQREYAWGREEVSEFFGDLSGALPDESYFLGLIILTGDGVKKGVVDGQQRILTLSLLASALFHLAKRHDRNALADRIQSIFLRAIDFDTDFEVPRVSLSSVLDDRTLRLILSTPAEQIGSAGEEQATVSTNLVDAYKLLTELLVLDLAEDPFKKLGTWADFIMNKLSFAVFVHDNTASAYRVYEIINTRGKELTTADLLKSYVLSQTNEAERERRYLQWKHLSEAFEGENSASFVQFIRHAVTTERGHVLPRDLYDVLTGRGRPARAPMLPDDLLSLLERWLPLYAQTNDPTVDGPASSDQLGVFAVLNALNVVSVRPILLAMSVAHNAEAGMKALLKLVTQRIVVGTLGTGNVERRFGQAAQKIAFDGRWEDAIGSLTDLVPSPEEFSDRIRHRSMSRNVLNVIRSSVLQQSITPNLDGHLYLIKTRESDWGGRSDEFVSSWVSTIGNSFLATVPRRPTGSSTWLGFKAHLLPAAVPGEITEILHGVQEWTENEIVSVGSKFADGAVDVWYRD